jgi:predicted nucleic acid-binding protein
MAADSFYDTNILLYGYDLNAKGKRKIALKLMEHAWLNLGSVAVSVQVHGQDYGGVVAINPFITAENAGD